MGVKKHTEPTKLARAVDKVADELLRIESPTGRLLAWGEFRRQVERQVFAHDRVCKKKAA